MGNVQGRLEEISDSNWREFVNSEQSILLLTAAECPHCKKWVDELKEFLDRDSDWTHIKFGKLVLDGDNVEDFKNSNEWLDLIDGVPFNIFYVAGEPQISFHGSGIRRLVRRLERLAKRE